MYRLFLLSLISLSIVASAVAKETRIDVHVISKGAKFIGTSMGGAEVTIEDAETGELLARGRTTGGTGDTAKIMQEPQTHHAPVSTDQAAEFQATLDLDRPRRLKVTARGPLAQPQATATASSTQWVVPGKSITGGDAWTLEIPGFVVDILNPPAAQKLTDSSDHVEVKANVTMMCGCPIEPDGLWDANRLEVAAIVRLNGQTISEVPLQFAGSTSQFAGRVKLPESGAYEITVYAYNPQDGNTGVDKTTVIR